MQQYLAALRQILDQGVDRPNRTGIATRSLFGLQMRFAMQDGFPAVTTKKLAFKTLKGELLAFLSGAHHVRDFQARGCRIWDANAEAPYWKPHAGEEGDLGRIYGVQWRSWRGPDGQAIDQLADVIARIRRDPDDRRLVVTAWNPGELDQMALPPCHMFFQFYVAEGRLSMQMYQRSCDMFLGVPFNIASYALLLHMVAQVTDLVPHEFIHVLGDAHIYHNHFDQVKEQLMRTPLSLPRLYLDPQRRTIDDFRMDDIRLEGYVSAPPLRADMAV